jgi:hypothetical protein
MLDAVVHVTLSNDSQDQGPSGPRVHDGFDAGMACEQVSLFLTLVKGGQLSGQQIVVVNKFPRSGEALVEVSLRVLLNCVDDLALL